jgi:hypothetical protein
MANSNNDIKNSTGMTPLMTNLGLGRGTSPPDISLDAPAEEHGRVETRRTHVTYHTTFRNDHHGPPTTGLGILMSSNSSSSATTLHHQHHGMIRQYTPEQHALIQKDAQDRERQARALAAAGMVVEQMTSNNGLHPPPTLGANSRQHQHSSVAANHISHDSHGGIEDQWTNLDHHHQDSSMDGENALTLDEMEMDFAKLFDPNEEVANMNTEGSGWPTTSSSAAAVQSDEKLYLPRDGGKVDGEI